MQLTQEILTYINQQQQQAFDLLVELAQIPAPSNHEEKRAAFCKTWLEKQGAQGVYVDEALNVIYPIGCTQDNPLTVYMAHSDVVFPDTEPLPLKVENGRIYCPGVGDDTANAVALLMTAKYIAQHDCRPSGCVRQCDHLVRMGLDARSEALRADCQNTCSARGSFLQIAHAFVQQLGLGQNSHQQTAGLDQGDGPVLQFTRCIALAEDIADFFELERRFQRQRIIHAAACKENVLGLTKAAGRPLKLSFT